MESKFRYPVFFPTVLLFTYIGLIISIILNFESTFTSAEAGSLVLLISLFAITFLFNEVNTKAVKVIFDKDEIVVRRFLGLAKERRVPLSSITGYNTSVVFGGRLGNFDYVYIMKENKKVAKISNQYHSNHKELFSFTEQKLKNLGFIHTGLRSQFKDIIK